MPSSPEADLEADLLPEDDLEADLLPEDDLEVNQSLSSQNRQCESYGAAKMSNVHARVPVEHITPKLQQYRVDAPKREKLLREAGNFDAAEQMRAWSEELEGYFTGKIPRHAIVSKDESERMRLNGETKKMMDHVKKRWKDRDYDTSKDEAWVTDQDGNAMSGGDPALASRDKFVWTITILWLSPKILALFLPMYVLGFPPVLVVYVYTSCQSAGKDTLDRNCAFHFVYAFSLILYSPVVILAAASLFLDYAFYYIFGFCFTMCTCRWNALFKSFAAIEPYRGGPNFFWYCPDIFTCIAGQTMRHGCVGTIYNLTVMWLLIPWVKYFWNCNPWVYDLDERFIQQISTSMEDLGTPQMGGIDNICNASRKIISRAKQYWYLRVREDYWHFVPHYPYPPEGRRWAIGMQAGGSGSSPLSFTLLVHTTHANSDHGDSSEQFVLSNSVYPGGKPVYRVMLWYNNPYHFLTGFVEASISNGGLSQPDKFNGGEHPMWLVTGKSPLLAGRNSMTGSGMIDAFFDDWLPMFVHECRHQSYYQATHNAECAELSSSELTLERHVEIMKKAHMVGQDKADKMYQQVVSTDGVSRCRNEMGRQSYAGKDTITIQQKQNSAYMNFMHRVVNAGEPNEKKLLHKRVLAHMRKVEHNREGVGD